MLWDEFGLMAPKEPESPAPDAYATAEEAVFAIICHGHSRTTFRSPYALNSQAAASAICAGINSLSLVRGKFIEWETAIPHVSEYDAKKTLWDASQSWAEANWPAAVIELREEAIKYFNEQYFSEIDTFHRFIARWQRLKNDSLLLGMLLSALEQENTLLDSQVRRLRLFKGDQVSAARVLRVIRAPRSSFHYRDEFASLIAEWAGDSVWGQLQYLLWHTGAQSEQKLTSLDVPSQSITNVAVLLREFGILKFERSSYELAELSAEARASWRRELKTVVGNDQLLRQATTEVLLWFGSPREDRAVLFAVLELYRDDLQQHIPFFLGHADLLVRRRARALIDLDGQEPDVMSLLEPKQSMPNHASMRSTNSLAPRTWIGDARIEQLIERHLDKVAGEVGSAIRKSLDSGEESHVMLLFERLRAEFSSITHRLQAFAAENNANEYLSLILQYRIVGKHEEGGRGVGSEKFSADICLLMEACDSGRRFARRASLIQAKRMYQKKKVDYYPFKKSQLDALAEQTLASFLLLLGPECDGIRIPIIPARLTLDLVERGSLCDQISLPYASQLGKGIATWLLEDVIGLWTGDWNQEIIARAEGRMSREPYILAEIKVDRVRKGPDGWPT